MKNCECFNWARQFNINTILSKHHPACKQYNPFLELKESIIDSLQYIEDFDIAANLASRVYIHLTTYKETLPITTLTDIEHIDIDIKTALLSDKNKEYIIINNEYYSYSDWSLHFYSDDKTHYTKDDNSYDLFINFIPHLTTHILLIKRK